MENKGHQPCTVSGELHFGGEWPGNKCVDHVAHRVLGQANFSDELVTYVPDWQRDRILWLINDQVVRERVPEHWGAPTDSHAPFDQHFHLLLNLAVGGTFGGAPDAHTSFPAAMEIDWGRVWQ